MTTLALFKIPLPVKTSKKFKKMNRPNDYLSVVERINGRAAMIGFSSALVDEIVTGHTISMQLHEHVGLAVAVSALAFLGTAVNPEDEGYVQGFFEPEKELVNGRLARLGGTWVRTYYSTPGKNFAGQGFTYYPEAENFAAPQPYPSWELNTETYKWEPPVPRPDDGEAYKWDEETVSWISLKGVN